jgi:hypothetical protein|eukprot:Transcript_9689.p2 GENE.Transcript_9689~~Transcript_9689.p2  ORF type:complete len:292 (-),score=68.55 Transcript_9689:346-1221(-)
MPEKADEDERCAEWARAGFCEQESYSAYMEANCQHACNLLAADGEAGQEESEETPTCEQWVAAGYCKVDKYKAYMEAHCLEECRVARSVHSRVGVLSAEEEDGPDDEDDTEDDAEEEEGEAEAEAGSQADDAAAAGEEPATCEQWARQGFCTEGQYVDYMTKSCKRACADASVTAGTGSSGSERSPEECAGWAARGMCSHPEYSAYMSQFCASTCRNMPEVTFKEELPPPVDVWLIFLIVGFGIAVSYVVRLAYTRDVSTSAAMRNKSEPTEVGTRVGNTGSAKRNKHKRL